VKLGTTGVSITINILSFGPVFFASGLVEFLHLFGVLKEPFWGLMPPIGLCYVGLMLAFHEQFLVFWRYLHLVSGMVTFPAVFILMYLPVRAMRIYRKKVDNRIVKPKSGSSSSGICFWRGKTLEDLNPIYTDMSVYNTPWPGMVAFFLCLEAVLWFEMTMRMGWWSGTNLPADVHHPEHAFLAMFIGDIIIVFVLFATVSVVVRFIDRCLGGTTHDCVDIELSTVIDRDNE